MKGWGVAVVLACVPVFFMAYAQQLTIARLKYGGGGDWYVSPTALPNLIRYCNEHLDMKLSVEEAVVEPSSPEIFHYPALYMTGHGNVYLSEQDVRNLRAYLLGGGFLIINDSYGMDEYIRRELKKLFPEYRLELVPINHLIYNEPFKFPNGLPKIHKHSGQPPQGLGIFHEGRLILFYAYESDIGDGWEDPQVHNDPPHLREQALRMGCNLLYYAFTQ